ncbi:RidA family protein [Roseobacter sp.]|uniref:RidA family protein n=1 Tax=Roseobacter sp. TaxID=1907202 RepID=UPI0038596DB4
MAHEEISPDGWAPAKGYANGILTTDGILFIGGQIGWNSDQVFETHEFVGQMEVALKNIATILDKAGGSISDLTRLTWYVKEKNEYLARQREVGQAYQRVLGKHFPAMTMVVVADLIEDEALVEIEATAVLQNRQDDTTDA